MVSLPAGALRRLTFQQYANSVGDLLGPRDHRAADRDRRPVRRRVHPHQRRRQRQRGQPARDRAVRRGGARAGAAGVRARGARRLRRLHARQRRRCLRAALPRRLRPPCLAPDPRRRRADPLRRRGRRDGPDVRRRVARPGGGHRGAAVVAALPLPASSWACPVAGDANRRVLSDDELATRLSYGLWDTTPDAALQDAAARGDLLKKPEVLRTTVERLLASPRARAAAARLLRRVAGHQRPGQERPGQGRGGVSRGHEDPGARHVPGGRGPGGEPGVRGDGRGPAVALRHPPHLRHRRAGPAVRPARRRRARGRPAVRR